MEQYIVNFINFIIDKKMVNTWRGFYVRLLLREIEKEEGRILEVDSRFNVRPDEDDGLVERIEGIEEYLINKKLATIISEDVKNGNKLRFTEEGEVLVLSGSVHNYEKIKTNRKIEQEERLKLDDDVKKSTVANNQLAKRLYWINFCIAATAYVSSVYYAYSLVTDYLNNHPCTPDCIFLILWFVFWVVLGGGLILLLWLLLRKFRKYTIE